MISFTRTKVVVVGGTGTLGTELTRRLLADDHHVTCLSRCELKQKQAQARFRSPNYHCILGDVRDTDTLVRAFQGARTVFHVAALKHVDTLEANPQESVKTNIDGTVNVADAAEVAGVHHVVFSSTDKAVFPINVYGMSKAIAERLLLDRNTDSETRFSVYRWGNVVGSRGSVIQTFVDALKQGKPVPITDIDMTRFWIRIEDAVDFMLRTYERPHDGPRIPPIKAAPVTDLLRATAQVLGITDYVTTVVGMRPGEKVHESLTEHIHSHSADRYTQEELVAMVRAAIGAAQ